MINKHLLISGALLIVASVVVIILARGLTVDSSKPRSVILGKVAPVLNLQWLNGYAPSAETALGRQPMVVNFWASWCLSCRQESQLLEKLWQDNNKRLSVVGIAVHDTKENALSFARRFGKSYFLALDRDGALAIDYGVTGVPETFIVDSQGIVQFHQIGAVTVEFLEQIHRLR